MKKAVLNFEDAYGDIHRWFGLSYANFLVLPRLVMQNMSKAWQKRFVKMLEELRSDFDYELDNAEEYAVFVRDRRGRLKPPLVWNYKYGNVEHLRRRKYDED